MRSSGSWRASGQIITSVGGRLVGAIEMARANPPAVTAGDLADDLPTLLAEVPKDAQLVVFHSAVLSYVSRAHRQAFADVLAEASTRREVVWLSNEAPGVIPEMTALAPSLDSHRSLLGCTHFTNGQRRDRLLALAHPHGAELVWL